MSFFAKKTAEGAERLTATLSALAAAGFPLAAGAPIPAPEAVAASIDSRLQAATAPLATQLAAAQARVEGLTHTLAAVGIALPELAAADFAPGADGAESTAVAAIRGAVEAIVARRAAQTIAATGHPAALAIAPGAAAAETDATVTPATAEEFLRTYRALSASDPSAAQVFFRRHRATFIH